MGGIILVYFIRKNSSNCIINSILYKFYNKNEFLGRFVLHFQGTNFYKTANCNLKYVHLVQSLLKYQTVIKHFFKNEEHKRFRHETKLVSYT